MQCIVFENPGEIDPRTISTFGVNVKPETESPIGIFGTGLKYAIAVLLREKQSIAIQIGERTCGLFVRTEDIRGKEFEVVHAADIKPLHTAAVSLGFTTELGKNWKLWMAYRELYCNAKDENGRVFAADSPPEPAPNITRVVVHGSAFAETHAARHEFILESEPLFLLPGVNLHRRGPNAIFFRGISVLSLLSPPLYSYNILAPLQLSEDRVASPYRVEIALASAIVACDQEPVIREVLTCGGDFYESKLDFNWHSVPDPGQVFISTMRALLAEDETRVNMSAITYFRNRTHERAPRTELKLTQVEYKILDRALTFLCSVLRCEIDHPIICVNSLGEGILGCAEDGKIYISKRAFLQGTKIVAGTIYEEYIHIRYGHDDFSRAMQNHLIDQVMSLAEQISGEPL